MVAWTASSGDKWQSDDEWLQAAEAEARQGTARNASAKPIISIEKHDHGYSYEESDRRQNKSRRK
jgi:hypothetical protein